MGINRSYFKFYTRTIKHGGKIWVPNACHSSRMAPLCVLCGKYRLKHKKKKKYLKCRAVRFHKVNHEGHSVLRSNLEKNKRATPTHRRNPI